MNNDWPHLSRVLGPYDLSFFLAAALVNLNRVPVIVAIHLYMFAALIRLRVRTGGRMPDRGFSGTPGASMSPAFSGSW